MDQLKYIHNHLQDLAIVKKTLGNVFSNHVYHICKKLLYLLQTIE